MGGRIEFGVASSSLILHHLRSCALKAIAIVGPNRIADLPNVPTMGEQGLGELEVRSALPLYGAKGLPVPIIERWNKTIGAALADASVKQRLANAHIDVTPMSPAELAQWLAAEYERLGKLIRQLGIKADGEA